MKNNPPIAAVATPMGKSSGAIIVRAATSTQTRNTLPSNTHTGSTLPVSYTHLTLPTNREV